MTLEEIQGMIRRHMGIEAAIASPSAVACRDCCARQRCHFCLQAGVYTATNGTQVYWSCGDHRGMLEQAIQTDPRHDPNKAVAHIVSTNPLLH